MATSEQVRWEQVQPILGAQPTQQVPFAQYVVNIGAVQGGVLNFGAPGQRAQDLIRPRPQPPQILPRRVPGFVDRNQEQRIVGQCLARDQVVDVHGPDGVGKTSLISQTMHTQIPGNFPDGMIYLTGRHQTRDDLLQGLFECFYESSTGSHVKVGENDVRRYLAGKRALVAIDDCNDLEEGDAEALSQAAPQSAMLIAGREPQAWGGAGVALQGLPRGDAVALLERLWGRPLGADAATADAICAVLGDLPLAIAKAVRTAAGRQVPLAQLLHEVQPQAAGAQPLAGAFFMLGNHLSDGERTLLSAVAAPSGDTVDRRALLAISGLAAPDVDRYLARLQKLELVHAEGGRYRLDEALRPYVRHYGADEAMRARAADYYRHLAGSLRAHSPDPDEENVIMALRYYYEQRDWPKVIEIVRALEPYLATTGRWGQWRRRLRYAGHAAQQIGDRATEAWVQNQLGIVALGAADVAAARQFFQGALSTWQALGDRNGATIARWNLQVLLGPPPPPPRRAEPRPSPEGGASPIVLALAGMAAALLIGLGVLAVIVS
ncbi:MAG TPA: NB-ARC domain-containing protein, partial [Anaerolineae bacterium]|nr:NB-ARC domain-containing protein [Anaerolineae bacterium]